MMRIFLLLTFFLSCLSLKAQISGTVFRDYNANGTRETGATFNEPSVQGITVMAYSAAGTVIASVSSSATGTYSFPASGANAVPSGTPVRLEFTGLSPQDYSGPAGGTSIQFVTAGASATNVNFGINYPQDYCQADPTLITSIMIFKNPDRFDDTAPGLVGNPYLERNTDSGDIDQDNIFAGVPDVGALYGLAYAKTSKNIYSSAFLKNMVGFGPGNVGIEGSTGAIYKVNVDGTYSVLLDISPNSPTNPNPALYSTGVNPHPKTGTNWFCDDAWKQVGKMSWGDIELSDDEQTLYAMNLYDRALYRINANTGVILGTHKIPGIIGGPTWNEPVTTNEELDLRPFGLKFWRGKLYLGVMNTAESSDNPNNLRAYVFEFNPDTNTYNTTPVTSFTPLNYDNGFEPYWSATASNNENRSPLLTDIEFVEDDMLLGLRNMALDVKANRNGTNYGPDCTKPIGSSNAAGVLIKSCFNGTTWDVETSGSCGGEAGYNTTTFFQQNVKHSPDYLGSLAVLQGSNEITATVIPGSNSGGTAFVSTNTHTWGPTPGEHNKVYSGESDYDNDGDPDVVNKANGLGDIELLCNPAPLEIGNRVWTDANSNGIQDAGEAGIDGITVELYEGTTLVGTTTTANGGQWYFNNSNVNQGGATELKPNTAYTIRVPSTAIPSGQTLTDTNTDGTTNGDLRDSDANLVSGNAEIAYTTGTYGQNDHTLDIGFKVACNLSASTTGNETNVSCNGGNNGAVGVTVSGNLAPVTYLWSNGATTGSITSLTAGTYTVTVTETPTCTAVASYTVTEPTLLDATCTKTDATTIGGNQGTASTSATGGTAPYTYLWSNGETTQSISNLTAGTYGVTVTDLNGCTANCMVTVQEPSCNLSATATGTNVLCNAGIGGTATATASGNLVPVTYLWSNGATTQSISNLTAGTYNVTVTEAPTCTAVTSYTVTEPTLLDAACSKTDATTIGGSQGTATVNATGGTAPYTYLWSNGATTASITGLTAGAYSVTVTDLNGCTANCMVTVQEPGCNLSATATGTDVSCNGGNNGTATATATGNLVPVTYLWSNGETTASITGLVTGTYTVTVTETPTCTAVASYTVTEPTLLDAACTKTDATTIGGNQGTASTSATGGTAPYTYLWSNGETTASISGLTAGTYTVTVTDLNGCTANCMVTVQEPGCNLSATATGTDVSCNGGNNGTAIATATGNLVPVTYLWSNGSTTASITGLTAGTYTVTVTETPTCTGVASYTVTEPTLLDAACSKTDATTIGGSQGTATVNATGGTAPYTYLWSNGETTASISGLTAGTYGVTVTDLNGCTANCMVTVQEPGCNLSATATGTDVSCNGGNNGTATATATGNLVPVTYLWSNGSTTASITGLTAGTYTVTVTETPTCTAVASYTVTEPTLLDAACSKTNATTIGGNQGTASVIATGGTAPYTYLWSNGETTASISGLTAGTYTVTVTDLNGCTANCMVTVQEPGCNLSATATGTDVSCNGGNNGTATATATGNIVPVTYLWSNGSTTASITGLTAGTYTVTVTETPTCTAVASYTVTEPLVMDAACSKTNATTIGGNQGTASVIATGGTAPYTYLWSNGETTASISGLTAGTYTVTVTDLNGCTANCMVTVQEPGCNLSATATGTDVSCNGGNNGTAIATATGNLVPVTYLWSNGSTTASITGLTAGTYTVTVTETPTCTAVASYTVTEPALLDAACSKTNATTIGGADGTASVIATGGTAPYTYLWSNGETTASISGLTAGTYTVTVTDLNGCTANCMVTVQEPGCNLSATATGTDVSCNAGTDGTAAATASGSLVPVTYLWSNGSTTASITGLTAGTYTVTVTETPTCTAVASYTVTEPALLDAACSKTNATTIGGADGTASVIATGGTAPYTYLWSNGETTQSISGLTAGTYSVTVTDLNGCAANCMVTVQEPGCNLSATAIGTNVLCNAGTDGTATATATGNLVPVTYLWSSGATTASITGLTAGTYTVTVTETPTCTAVASYTVTEPTLLDAACSKTDVTTIGGADGTASVIATGGTAPYTYLWSNGQTTASISGITAGTYTVTVTDLNGCTANCMVTVQEPGCNLSANATGTDVSCNGGNNGTATATATGNLVPVTYLWSNGATTQSISNLTAGTYTVTVTETPTCTAVASYTVTEPLVMDAACSKTNATTIGGSQGTATVNATGGTAPYTYLWSNGETTASITGLTAGTYSVTVTDLNGCTANCSVTVQESGCPPAKCLPIGFIKN